MTRACSCAAGADLIAGQWRGLCAGGNAEAIIARNPARPRSAVWSGVPRLTHVDEAIAAARAALPLWSSWPQARRFGVLERFRAICASRVDAVASRIREETGKVAWDAKAEAALLESKVAITLDPTGGLTRVSGSTAALTDSREGRCWFRPHGVMAVIGPFNFPAHLPNGHIIPAMAMGNTIVFKPSEKAPGTGQLLAEMLDQALRESGAPAGVVNLVHGDSAAAKALVSHDDIDGILFTGSWPVGRAILQANIDRPGRICALEMGGNNAAVVMPDADIRQAAIECVRSAFISSGQRCTCTRRVVVHQDVAQRFISAVCLAASNLIVGEPDASHPVFMGPVISDQARAAVLSAQADMGAAGAEILVPCVIPDSPSDGWYITPGVVRVDRFVPVDDGSPGGDREVFGPLLRVCVAGSLDEAIAQANATRYGLAASIFTRDQLAIDRFLREARAGCVNVNTGTAGASSKLPFGGLGLSGNHRPAGAFSLDYCAYPVAGMIERSGAATLPPGMRFEPSWA